MSVARFEPFGDPFRQLDRLTSQLLSGRRTPLGMPMDVWEAEDGYHVVLDLPGVNPDDVDITCERSVLTIRAARSPEYGEDQNVLIAERPQGTYTRQLQLGEGLDTEKVEAAYQNGVLRLTIPKSTAAQARRIDIRRTGGDQPTATPIETSSPSGDEFSGNES